MKLLNHYQFSDTSYKHSEVNEEFRSHARIYIPLWM